MSSVSLHHMTHLPAPTEVLSNLTISSPPREDKAWSLLKNIPQHTIHEEILIEEILIHNQQHEMTQEKDYGNN